MRIVKVFTRPDSIKHAFELMSKYPFIERPKIFIAYRENHEICFTSGTLWHIDSTHYPTAVIINNNYEKEGVEIPLIEELQISNMRMKI